MVECCHRVRDQATLGISAEELKQLKNTCDKIRQNLDSSAMEACSIVKDAMESSIPS